MKFLLKLMLKLLTLKQNKKLKKKLKKKHKKRKKKQLNLKLLLPQKNLLKKNRNLNQTKMKRTCLYGVLAKKRILPFSVQIRMQRYSNLFYIIFVGGISTDVSIW